MVVWEEWNVVGWSGVRRSDAEVHAAAIASAASLLTSALTQSTTQLAIASHL